jgi:y4mF family transcriptional regulator
MELGDFVRGERKRQGLTQQQLASKSGVGLNFVYQLEKNKPSVQLDSLNQVLRALGYSVSVKRDFRPWETPANPPPEEPVSHEPKRAAASARRSSERGWGAL